MPPKRAKPRDDDGDDSAGGGAAPKASRPQDVTRRRACPRTLPLRKRCSLLACIARPHVPSAPRLRRRLCLSLSLSLSHMRHC